MGELHWKTLTLTFGWVLLQSLAAGQTTQATIIDSISIWVLAAVGGLILLLIVAMIIFVCVIYCKKKEETMKVIHVRSVEDWSCHHRPIIMNSTATGMAVPKDSVYCQTSPSLVSLFTTATTNTPAAAPRDPADTDRRDSTKAESDHDDRRREAAERRAAARRHDTLAAAAERDRERGPVPDLDRGRESEPEAGRRQPDPPGVRAERKEPRRPNGWQPFTRGVKSEI